MEVLLSKPAVVALAVVGALLAVCASVLGAKGKLSEAQAERLNFDAYIVMGATMLLFALVGLRCAPA